MTLIQITKSQEARAAVEKVWAIVADLDNEHKPWPVLRSVKILSKSKDTLEREVKIRRGPMGEAKSTQTLTVDSARLVTTLTMTKGPMLGTRKIALTRVSDNETKIDIEWIFEMKGVPGFALGFVKDNISGATEKALSQIAEEAAEGGASTNSIGTK
jgi:ribosome-associated toxin RatA of RatAB toxin-antitoxin module